MNKNEILRVAANEFAEKVHKLSSPIEIAIMGSVAGDDPYPNDLDLVIIIHNLKEIITIAKYARQMSRYYHGWEVFLFDEDVSLIGRICHRRKCPVQSVDCSITGCGQPPYLRVHSDFNYQEKIFFNSPIDVLWTSFKRSRLLERKDELGIAESRRYPVLEDIKIKCILCSKIFLFTASEQKWYKKQGFSLPKRCPDCIEQERIK
ncbi:MAG: zinc-ribbon domain containing protein [Atribacterota bacterium]